MTLWNPLEERRNKDPMKCALVPTRTYSVGRGGLCSSRLSTSILRTSVEEVVVPGVVEGGEVPIPGDHH